MQQTSIGFEASQIGGNRWLLKLAWLRRAVDILGHKAVAAELDVAPSQLTDALLERERKDVKGKWFDIVLAMGLSREMRDEWMRINCDALGYEMPKLKRIKTAEDEVQEMREFLSKNAPALLAMFEGAKR